MAWPHYATYSTLMSHFHFVSSEIIIANLFQLKKQKAVTEGRLQAAGCRLSSHLVPPFMDRQCSTYEIWTQKKLLEPEILWMEILYNSVDIFHKQISLDTLYLQKIFGLFHYKVWDIFALKLRFFLFSRHNISDIWDNL